MKNRMRFLITTVVSLSLCFSSLVSGSEIKTQVETVAMTEAEEDEAQSDTVDVLTKDGSTNDISSEMADSTSVVVGDDQTETEETETEEVVISKTETEEVDDEETQADTVVENASDSDMETVEAYSEEIEAYEEVQNGLITTDDGKIRYLVDGVPQTGLQTVNVDGNDMTFFFESNGDAFTEGFKCVGHDRYYFTKDGNAFNEGLLQFVHTNGKTYYFYFQPDGTAFSNGYKCCRPVAMADRDGNITYKSENSAHYYFMPNGIAYTGGFLEFVHTNGKMYYFYFGSNGRAYTNGYKAISTRHHADSIGTITDISGETRYYYFQQNGRAYTNGVLQFMHTNGREYIYYFQSNGAAFTEGYKSATTRYYADANGTLTNITNGGQYFFFRNNGQAYKDGALRFVHTNGKTYDFYFYGDGCAAKSEDKTFSTRYYADANGNISNMSDGKKYTYRYAENGHGTLSGKGWVQDGANWRYFNDLGECVVTSNNMYKAWTKIKSLSSATKYFVVVDCTNCETYIFKGSVGNWAPVKCWKCSPGKSSTPTVKGTFKVGSKGYCFHGPKGSTLTYTCYYWTQISGSYLFHSVLYNYNTFTIDDGRLGRNLSHGCVRLAIDNAKWLQDNIPSSTKILIY